MERENSVLFSCQRCTRCPTYSPRRTVLPWIETSVSGLISKVFAYGQLYATRTRFGCSLNGPVESESFVEESAFSNCAHADERIDTQVEHFWKLETREALANSLQQFSVDDKIAVDI